MCSWADDDDQAWQRDHAMLKAELATMIRLRDNYPQLVDADTFRYWANRRILHYTQEQR